MKRTVAVLLGAMFLVVSLSAGPALAALPLIVGTDAAERITGTRNAEEIRGRGGPDEITDGLGADNLIGYGGGTSVDRFYGGQGNDVVQSRDVPAVRDVVGCGGGTDTVYADEADVVGGDCERAKAW